MSTSTVQFWGTDSVIEAFENRKVPSWALFQGKQFLFKYEGSDLAEGTQNLTQILEAFNSSTNAIYTLKLYEDFKDGQKIKSTTPDDGSFNFRLNMPDQSMTVAHLGSFNSRQSLEKKFSELEQKYLLLEARLSDSDVDDAEEDDFFEKISGLLEKPVVIGALNKILGLDLKPGGSIGHIPDTGRGVASEEDAERRINDSIERLKVHDDHLAEHLSKLADIAENKPKNFRFLLSTLDSL